MRWPFTKWLRGAPAGDDPSPGASEPAGSAVAPEPVPGPLAMARPTAWREAPPLQRAVGAAPLTAPSAAFARDLAGRRTPDPMLVPLGHDLAADGPAGLVSGIAVPLVQRAPSSSDGRPVPALPAPVAFERGRQTARRSVTPAAAWPPSDGVESATTAAAPEETAAEAIAGPAAGGSTPELPILVPRTLPVAQPATATPALAATRVADATAPAPVLAVARAVAAGAPSGSRGPLSGATSVAAAGPASGPAPGESVAATPPASAGADDPVRPAMSRRTLGESRRLGLGAPLTGRPPSAAIEPGRADLPVARLPRSTDSSGWTPASARIAPATPPAAAAPAPLPRLVVARRATTAPGFATGTPTPSLGSAGEPAEAPARTAGEPPADESGPGGTAVVARSLVGESVIGVSRLARDGAPADADGDAAESRGPALPLDRASSPAAAAPGAEPTTGRWPESGGAPAAGTAATAGSPATAGRTGTAGFAALQRSHAAPAGGEPAQPAGASSAARAAAPLAPLVPGRAMRASQPGAISTLGFGPAGEPAPVVARLAIPPLGTAGGRDAGPALTSETAGSPGRSTPAAGPRSDERPFVSRPAPVVGSSGPSSAATPALTLSRSATGPAVPETGRSGASDGGASWTPGAGFTRIAAAPSPFVQRTVTIDEMTVTPGAEAGGAPGAEAGAGDSPGASSAGAAGTDYEELAEQVYDKIRARLTTELLLDRERAGMLVDG